MAEYINIITRSCHFLISYRIGHLDLYTYDITLILLIVVIEAAASHMFEDQKEALKLLKKNPGARFKVFRSRKDAESFAGLRENLSTPRSVEIERKEKNATLPKVSCMGMMLF